VEEGEEQTRAILPFAMHGEKQEISSPISTQAHTTVRTLPILFSGAQDTGCCSGQVFLMERI
jgi:hypothetical protein